MNLCSSYHEEVCYEGRDCPVCDWIGQLDEVKGELARAEKKIDELNGEITELNEG